MAASPSEFMDAANDFLANVEASKLVAKAEMETIRKGLVSDLRREGKRTVNSLQTAKVGSARVLIPNADNLRKINLSSERTRKRMSSFRLNYLDRSQVSQLRADGRTMTTDPGKFIRQSRRMARHSRDLLQRLGEQEPDLQEEIDATLQQIEDNDMDLLKMEVRSMTRMKETLLRGVNGRKERGQVLKEFDDFDINKSIFNLALLEHPDAVVRSMFANASERMAAATTTKTSEIAKRAHVFVGLPPNAAAAMKPNSRVANLSWRVTDTKSLNERFKNLPGKQGSPSTWRGLGLDFNTKEWYIPVPPALVAGITPIAASRRTAALATAEVAAAEAAAATLVSQRAALARAEQRALAVAQLEEERLAAEQAVAEELAKRSAIVTPPL